MRQRLVAGQVFSVYVKYGSHAQHDHYQPHGNGGKNTAEEGHHESQHEGTVPLLLWPNIIWGRGAMVKRPLPL